MTSSNQKKNKRIRWLLIAGIFAIVLMATMWALSRDWSSKEELICQLPDGFETKNIGTYAISADGMDCVIKLCKPLSTTKYSSHIVTSKLGLIPLPTTALTMTDLAITPDGKHMAAIIEWSESLSSPKHIAVMHDGKIVAEYEDKKYGGCWWRLKDDGVLEYKAKNDLGKEYLVTAAGRSKDYDSLTMVMEEHGSQVWKGSRDGAKYILSNGVEVAGPFNAKTRAWPVRFNSDGSCYACVVHESENKHLAIINGKQTDFYQDLIKATVSPTGNRFAFAAFDGKDWMLVTDNASYKTQDWTEPVFSPDGKIVAYRDGKRMIINGKESKTYLRLSGPVFFGENPSHIAYAGLTENGSELIIDEEIKTYPNIHIYEIAFSPDGKRLAFSAIKKKTYAPCVIIDGIEKPGYDGVSKLTFSPDGKRLAYIVQNGKSKSVICDNKIGAAYEDIEPPFFDKDNRLHYVVKKDDGKKKAIVTEDIEGEWDHYLRFAYNTGHKFYFGLGGIVEQPRQYIEYTSLFNYPPDDAICDKDRCLITTPQYCHCAYVAQDCLDSGSPATSCKMVIDGKAGPAFFRVSGLTFSKDGNRYAYIGFREHGNQYSLVVDGKETHIPNPSDSPTFSRDGQHLAYRQGENGTPFRRLAKDILRGFSPLSISPHGQIVLDNKPLNRYDWVSQPVFRPDGTLVYFAIRNGGLYRVTRPL